MTTDDINDGLDFLKDLQVGEFGRADSPTVHKKTTFKCSYWVKMTLHCIFNKANILNGQQGLKPLC